MGHPFNDIAALLEGKPYPEGPERPALDLGDREMLEVLSLASLSNLTQPPDLNYPFRVEGGVLAGLHGGFFRILFTDGLQFRGLAGTLTNSLARIFDNRLPLCFKQEMTVELDLGAAAPIVKIQASKEGCSLRVESSGTEIGELEVWAEGDLRRSFTASNGSSAPPIPFGLGTFLAVRQAGAERGAGIYLVPLEFGRRDWIAACVSSALTGDILEATRILKHEIRSGREEGNRLNRFTTLVSSVFAVTKLVNGSLFPVPVTRGGEAEYEERLAAYSPVWEGICACWPRAAEYPNPWTANECEEVSEVNLPNEADLLIDTVIQATRRTPDPSELAPLSGSSSEVRAGWAALNGWTHILSGRPSDALNAFDSVEVTEADPFLLKSSRELARHLAEVQTGTTTGEKIQASSDRVWKEVFQPLIQ